MKDERPLNGDHSFLLIKIKDQLLHSLWYLNVPSDCCLFHTLRSSSTSTWHYQTVHIKLSYTSDFSSLLSSSFFIKKDEWHVFITTVHWVYRTPYHKRRYEGKWEGLHPMLPNDSILHICIQLPVDRHHSSLSTLLHSLSLPSLSLHSFDRNSLLTPIHQLPLDSLSHWINSFPMDNLHSNPFSNRSHQLHPLFSF